MVFLVVMYGWEIRTIKKVLSNCDAGEDSWESLGQQGEKNQTILKEINPEYSLKGLTLKLEYFGHLMGRANSLGKTLMLGRIEGRRRRQQRMRWLDGLIHSTDMSLKQLQEIVKNKEAWHVAAHEVTELDMTERLNNNNDNCRYFKSDYILQIETQTIVY